MGTAKGLNFQARRSPVLGTHAAVSSSQPLACTSNNHDSSIEYIIEY